MGAADPKGCAREGCVSLRPRLWDNGGISLPALRAGTATANTISSMFEVRADPLLFFFLCRTRKRRVNKVSVSEGLSVPEKKERRRRRKNLAHRISNRVTASRSAEIAQIMKFSTTPESEVHRPPRCIQTFAIFCSEELRLLAAARPWCADAATRPLQRQPGQPSSAPRWPLPSPPLPPPLLPSAPTSPSRGHDGRPTPYIFDGRSTACRGARAS